MKILHVGNGNFNHSGSKYYDVGRKLNNGFVRNGHNVYFISDRDVARSSNILGIRKFGKSTANKYFLDVCNNFQPDLIVFGHADIISPDSLRRAREYLPQSKFIQYNVDPIFRPHNIAMINSKSPFLDATFCTTAGQGLQKFALNGGVVSFMPNPVDESIENIRCHENSQQDHDVFWAMRGLKGSHPEDMRVELPLLLERSGINIDYYGFNRKPELFGANYFKAIANCKMGLNISVKYTFSPEEQIDKNDLYLYSSDRISHYMGCGLLVFTTRDNCLEELFIEDKELVFFSTSQELLDKVRYYSKNDKERKKIAKAGWEKYHNSFNEKTVAKYIEEVAFARKFSQSYAWPTELYRGENV